MTRKEMQELTACPNCGKKIAPEVWTARGGKLASMKRKTRSGMAAKARPCPYCNAQVMGKYALADHKRGCAQNPRRKRHSR